MFPDLLFCFLIWQLCMYHGLINMEPRLIVDVPILIANVRYLILSFQVFEYRLERDLRVIWLYSIFSNYHGLNLFYYLVHPIYLMLILEINHYFQRMVFHDSIEIQFMIFFH